MCRLKFSTNLSSAGTECSAHLLPALSDAALALEEALHLLLGPVRDIVPDPVAGCADARRASQECKVVQVFPEVCRCTQW